MRQPVESIEVNGARLGYEVRSRGSGKPALVFTHGYAMQATGGLYAALLDRLARHFTVFGLDLRGQGASAGATDRWSFDVVADDVHAFVRVLDLDRPVFVGHSFGAVVGLLAELRHPDTFRALCLLSPGPADHRRDPVETLDALIEHGQDRDAMHGGFRAMFIREPGELLDLALDAVTLVDPVVHRAQKAENPHFSIDDRLGAVAAPVLVVSGEGDGVVPPERQHDMAGKLPHSKEVVFPDEGHMLAIERPDLTAREIIAFLTGVE